MKSKFLLLPLILLSLSLIALPVQAVKPEVIETRTIITETRIEPGGGVLFSVLLTELEHANTVLKPNGDFAFAHLTSHILQRIVDEEGNLLAIINQQVTYSGIIKYVPEIFEMSFYTGTATIEWQVHIFEGGEWIADLVPMQPELHGARSLKFKNGEIIRKGGFGDYSWLEFHALP